MKRENLVWGVLLILVGGAFLLLQFFPDLFGFFSWPWILVAIGALFTVAALVSRTGGLFIPGFIALTLGGIFLYQMDTGNWESWSYVWALMPIAAGAGMLVGGLMDRELRQVRQVAVGMILGGLVMFAIFGGIFGLDSNLTRYWPVLLILLGLGVLVKAMRPEKR